MALPLLLAGGGGSPAAGGAYFDRSRPGARGSGLRACGSSPRGRPPPSLRLSVRVAGHPPWGARSPPPTTSKGEPDPLLPRRAAAAAAAALLRSGAEVARIKSRRVAPVPLLSSLYFSLRLITLLPQADPPGRIAPAADPAAWCPTAGLRSSNPRRRRLRSGGVDPRRQRSRSGGAAGWKSGERRRRRVDGLAGPAAHGWARYFP